MERWNGGRAIVRELGYADDNVERLQAEAALQGRSASLARQEQEACHVITCYLRYVIDPYKLEEFERYARMVIAIPSRFGGKCHGYFLPHEGPNNIAIGLFSFPSLAEYEQYREAIRADEAAQKAWHYADETRCVLSFERSFMRPILPD